MSEIKAAFTLEYQGTTIEYIEADNKFRFELRGRERKAESLKQAKEWIDKPEPAKKSSKPFKRFEALFSGAWSGHDKINRKVVTVTSAAQDTHRGTNTPSAAWILRDGGDNRSKEPVEKLFEINDANTKKWEEYDTLVGEAARLTKKAEALVKTMKRIDLTAYFDGDENKKLTDN